MLSMVNGLVSVYIPTRNRAALLNRAVNSILQQTYQNFEIIIVDDGSNDETYRYIQSICKKDSRISFYRNKTPKGACAARNIAIKSALGEFITGLDDDDIFMPKRLELLVRSFNSNSNYSFLTTGFMKSNSKMSTPTLIFDEHMLFDDNVGGNQVFTYTMRVRAVDGFDEELKSAQDMDLMVRLCQKFGFALRTSDETYKLDVSHGFNRISSSSSKVIGMKQFYSKHSCYMSFRQRLHYCALILLWSSQNKWRHPLLMSLVVVTNPRKALVKLKSKLF
jgi:glycosyltransferase involved in cell wall biosynthesis